MSKTDDVITKNPRLAQLVADFAPFLSVSSAGFELASDAPERARWAFAEFSALSAQLEQRTQACSQRERMLANLPYQSWKDGLPELRAENERRQYEYNHLPPERWDERPALLRGLLGGCGRQAEIRPPCYFDYGRNTTVGENFYANYNLMVLDVAHVTIGDNVLLAPNVSIYTAGHPLHPQMRNDGYEYGIDVTIGDNVWIGGGATILPGVTIGSNTVVGAGSVVTHDLPESVLAAGNPCRVIRAITEADRDFYYKDRRFDAAGC